MKRGLEARQITALERTQRNLERWKKLKAKPPKELRIESARTGGTLAVPKDIEEFIDNKIAKAEKCIANLEAKGVVLKEKK